MIHIVGKNHLINLDDPCLVFQTRFIFMTLDLCVKTSSIFYIILDTTPFCT